MVCPYIPCFLALFFLVVPRESIGQNGQLAELNDVKVAVEYLPGKLERLGLRRQAITDHAFVILRSKLPRLTVNNSASSIVYININLELGSTTRRVEIDYFGAIEVSVMRTVRIIKTNGVTYADLWGRSMRGIFPSKDQVGW